jgi:hypothetical protein
MTQTLSLKLRPQGSHLRASRVSNDCCREPDLSLIIPPLWIGYEIRVTMVTDISCTSHLEDAGEAGPVQSTASLRATRESKIQL